MFALADRTGWPIDYILWDVPLSILYQGTFVSLWIKGIKLKRPEAFMPINERKEIEKLLGLTK